MLNDKKNWLIRLKEGLTKSSSKITTGLNKIFSLQKIDQNSLEQLEELLISADLGVATASYLVEKVSKHKFSKENLIGDVKNYLAELIINILSEVENPIEFNAAHQPQVILICGVNGNGKTTTIGKLASFYQAQGKKVMLAACDTFRAAAVEQLAIWAKRANCPIVQGEVNSDPASVAYLAMLEAKKNNIDILLIDTAGRLHNKANLMEELAKIVRVIKKIDQSAPHNNLLILDATTGQNAHKQLESFNKIIPVTGIIVTKLDGTAKAGIVIALARDFKVNIHAIGVGEKIEDFQIFNARDFTNKLLVN